MRVEHLKGRGLLEKQDADERVESNIEMDVTLTRFGIDSAVLG
jgi:hypothetical protein